MLGPIDFANRQLSKTAFRPFEKFPFATLPTAPGILSPTSSSLSPPPQPSSSISLPSLPPTNQSLYASTAFSMNDVGSSYHVFPNQPQVDKSCAAYSEYDDRLLRHHVLASMLPYTLPQELLSRLLPNVQTSTPPSQPVESPLIHGLASPPPPPPPSSALSSAALQVYPEFLHQMSHLSTYQGESQIRIETGMGPQEAGIDLTTKRSKPEALTPPALMPVRDGSGEAAGEDSFWTLFQRLQSIQVLEKPSESVKDDALTSSPKSSLYRSPGGYKTGSDARSQPKREGSRSRDGQTFKKRKSGFQAGVTVGYTYEAFFVSDGRSRKRRSFDSTIGGSTTAGELVSPGKTASTSLPEGLTTESVDFGKHISAQSITSSPSPSSGFDSQSCTSITPPVVKSGLLLASPDDATSHNQRFTCAECGKHYATSSNLSRHKQTHRSLDSQLAKKCPHCGKLYVSMPALSMHILTHDLRHQCDICGKAFSRPWLLQGHRRAHTGEKPYGCAHCGRAFADRSNLRAHMQTHSTLKHFECPRCKKTFALKTYLTKHLELSCCGGQVEEDSKTTSASYSVSSTADFDGTERCSNSSRKLLPLSIAALVGDHCEEISAQN